MLVATDELTAILASNSGLCVAGSVRRINDQGQQVGAIFQYRMACKSAF
jgi:hypothetical protein